MSNSPLHRVFLLLSSLAIFFACVQPGECQSTASQEQAANQPSVRLQVRNDELTVTIPLVRLDKITHSTVRLTLLNPEDVVRAQLITKVDLARHQKQLIVRLANPFQKVPAQKMEALHWLRLKYEVTAMDGRVLVAGIEALQAPTTDPFILTAAASRVAATGRPYRVQVHVKANNGVPIAAVEVYGTLTWDEDAGEKKLSAKATTNTAGNATLEFPIPREVEADNGDLTVAVKSGLIARLVQQNVDFYSRSYLLLDTDKDIYQPGQTLHARVLRFDSDRKAVEKETLDFRIEDEERTLVFKQTVDTDAFGVAHVDWQVPANARQGNYGLRVGVGGQYDDWRRPHADRFVHIYRYDLPNFRVSAKPDKTYYLPGQKAEVAVSAEYLFGKPVTRGKIRVVEESDRTWNYRKQQWDVEEGQVQTGELDRDGHFNARFDLTRHHDELKDDDYRQFRDVELAAYITDLTTGRTEQRRFQLRATKNPIHVYLSDVPPRNSKFPRSFYISTFYADGTPARCKVLLSLSDEDNDKQTYSKLPLRTVETNKYGLAKVKDLIMPKDEDRDSILAEARDSRGLEGRNAEGIYSSDEDLGLVEVYTSHAIHKAGDPIEVTVRSTRPALRLVVQAIREGVVLATQQVKLRNARGTATFPYDPRFTDEVSIFAFSLQEEWGPSVMLEGWRTVLYPKNRQLEVAVQLDKNEHRPGEDAAARFSVRSADKTGTASALGIKVVDRAVEERAQTDSDFGQRYGGGWWRWSLWSSDNDSGFAGISRDDLDRIDLTEPVPPDLDLAAEFILRSGYRDALDLLDDRSSLTPEGVFSKILGAQFAPLVSSLQKSNEQGKVPHDIAELETTGKHYGVDVTSLRDPWGTPYRYEIQFQRSDHIVIATSAGPDKHFGTNDDFTAHRSSRNYFTYYGKLLESTSRDLMEKESRFIRDRATLQAELLKRGVDFNALRDPWGNPYETEFTVSGSYYLIAIVSHGAPPPPKKDATNTTVWSERVDYFVKSREHINKVLSAHLTSGGAYPSNEAEFKSVLRKTGVDLDELRDPWGHPYYTTFQRTAEYSDRVEIRQTNRSGERMGEPVTLVRQNVNVMSAGKDGNPGTGDDFQVAGYSTLVSEQSAKDRGPRPAPAGVNLAGGTGAIIGVVIDPSEAVIAGATVEAAREGTEEKRTVKTDYYGRFELKGLAPGFYDLRAYANGFRALEVKVVRVESGALTEISFALSLSTTREVVEVSAGAVQVETSSTFSVSGVRTLPYIVKLSPGVVTVTKSGTMSTPRLRQDFPETMLWAPALVTDRRGHAKLNFKLADNITTWKLTATASTKNGELGRAEKDLRAFQPFFLEHDPPRILTEGDEISYPVVLRNYLDRAQTLKASIKPEPWFTLLGPAEVPAKVEAGDAAHAVFRYRAAASVTDGKQQVSAANSEISDAAQKPVDVHPFGLPLSLTAGGIIDQKGTLAVNIPNNVIAGSMRARVKIYPSLVAHVVENLEAGLERPHGCGEQTISSTYPSLLVAEIYAESDHKPAIVSRAQRYLAAGYERLLRYQSESGGFSYWGYPEAADLALTAYALEFLQHAASLTAVDDGVIKAAERFVLEQQRPDGSWHGRWDRNDKDALLLTAYIAQTLAQLKPADADKPDARRARLDRALAFLAAHRELADEPYTIASYALAAKAVGNDKVFTELREWLRKNLHHENSAVYWVLERNTPFYGWGRTGRLESTALAVRALAAGAGPNDADQTLIRQGFLFLLRNQQKDGMWYSGQTTVHVLKTLLSMARTSEREPGSKLSLRVNGKDAKVVDLPAADAVVAPIEVDVSSFMVPGENHVELESPSKSMMSAQLAAESYIPWESPVVSKQEPNSTSKLQLSVQYSRTQAAIGESIECRVRAERIGFQGYGMMLGEIGLPPGADVDRESLEQAVQGGYALYRYDVTPDRVVVYLWPQAGGSEFSFKFRPRFAMSAETAPSLLYDYYNPEASVTLKPSRFDVAPGSDR